MTLDLDSTAARVAACPAPTVSFRKHEAAELVRLARVGALAEEKAAAVQE